MARMRTFMVANGIVLWAAFGLPTPAVANAGPFCYETGPGFEKCISSPSGDYFSPIYHGPKLPDGYISSVPYTPAPPSISSNDPTATTGCPQGSYVDPSDLRSCLPDTPGNDYVSLATPSSNPTATTFGTATTQSKADEIAIAQCVSRSRSTCLVSAQAYHACVHLAVRTNGVVVSGVGPDLASASAAALKAAPGGQMLGGYCADPPGN